jgi:hypothetical protein
MKYVSFGTPSTEEATSNGTSTWTDANTIYTYPQTLLGSSDYGRWLITSATNGSILGSINLFPVYLHQYFVTIKQNSLLAGSVSKPSGWYNSTSHISISSKAAEGWHFEGWTGNGEGSYTGPSETATLNVSAPITETLIFYPGLKISVNGAGYINYAFGSVNGTVNSGNFTTVYVPIGTEVKLNESPTNFLYSFTNWVGSVNSTSKSISLTISRPLNEQANFKNNYLIIGMMVGFEAAIIIITYYIPGKKIIEKSKVTRSASVDDYKNCTHDQGSWNLGRALGCLEILNPRTITPNLPAPTTRACNACVCLNL